MIRKYCKFLGFSVHDDGSEEYHCHYYHTDCGQDCNCEYCWRWEKRDDYDENESEVKE